MRSAAASDRPLEGRAILVTGGARGIGRAIARACLEGGAAVALADLGCAVDGTGADPEPLREAAAELGALGRVLPMHEDVAAPGAASRIVGASVTALGALDGLVHAAGVGVDQGLLKLDDRALDRALDVHVRAAVALVRAGARAMGEGGSIVLSTSPVAFFGGSRVAAEAVAAGAVVGLTRAAAVELRRAGVRVNALAATARTRATASAPPIRSAPTGTMEPADVAPVAVFLLSDASAGVTGEVVAAAGTRVYTLQSRETPGAFGEGGPMTVPEIAARWADVRRP